MSTNKLYIHIGLPKTATTTIQQHLKANRVLLEQAGIDYCWQLCELNGKKVAAHHALGHFICGTQQGKGYDFKLDNLKPKFESPETILSSEVFHLANESQINKLVTTWNLPVDRKVVVTVRDEIDYIRSYWTQAVKTGAHIIPLRDYYFNVYKPKRVTVNELLKRWECQGFEPVVIDYNELKAGNDITTSFLGHFLSGGINTARWKNVGDRNVSPDINFVYKYQSVMSKLKRTRVGSYYINSRTAQQMQKFHYNMAKVFPSALLAKNTLLSDLEAIKDDLAELPPFYQKIYT